MTASSSLATYSIGRIRRKKSFIYLAILDTWSNQIMWCISYDSMQFAYYLLHFLFDKKYIEIKRNITYKYIRLWTIISWSPAIYEAIKGYDVYHMTAGSRFGWTKRWIYHKNQPGPNQTKNHVDIIEMLFAHLPPAVWEILRPLFYW